MSKPAKGGKKSKTPATPNGPGAADGVPAAALLARYPGPVLIIDDSARAVPINETGRELAENLNSDGGHALFPQLIQLAVKARTTGRAQTRIVPLPDGRRRLEVTLLPQDAGDVLMLGRDATLETNIRTALTESRTRFQDLIEIAADFAWETDAEGRFTYISQGGALGYRPEELTGTVVMEMMVDPDLSPRPLPFQSTEDLSNVEIWLWDRERNEACLRVSATPILDENGRPEGSRGIAIDITQDRMRRNELTRIKLRDKLVADIVGALRGEVTPLEMLEAAATALDRSSSAETCVVHIIDPKTDPYIAAVHGSPPDPDLAAAAVAAFDGTEGPGTREVGDHAVLGIVTRYRGRPNGLLTLWRPVSATDWDDQEIALLAAVEPQFGIAFQQLLDQQTLEHLSRTDELTELPNRRAFLDDLERNLKRCARHDKRSGLLFIDLDNFKPINDIHGHDAGDTVLRSVARVIVESVRPYDLCCRLGGDEFAVWLEGADRAAALNRATAIRDRIVALNDAATLGFDPDPALSASIGVAVHWPDRGEPRDDLVRRADAAMYRAKRAGKNCVEVDPGPTGGSKGGGSTGGGTNGRDGVGEVLAAGDGAK